MTSAPTPTAAAPAVGGPGTVRRRRRAAGGRGCPPPPTHTGEGWCRRSAPLCLTSRRPLIERANRATAAGTGEKGKRARAAGAHEDWDSGTSHRSRPVSLLGRPPADPERIEKVMARLKGVFPICEVCKQWIVACSVKRCIMPLCNGAIRYVYRALFFSSHMCFLQLDDFYKVLLSVVLTWSMICVTIIEIREKPRFSLEVQACVVPSKVPKIDV
ncbi:uncharacterized protein [Miscanthus floridulus]|uniref:uncharacterized protein isoform X3 n=1 Tax=Miscanthus floridulus TaxID=154761 RepID=UPI0034574E18